MRTLFTTARWIVTLVGLAALWLVSSQSPTRVPIANAQYPLTAMEMAAPNGDGDTASCRRVPQLVSSPNLGSSVNVLTSVAAQSSPTRNDNNIWAVGYYNNPGMPPRTLIQRATRTGWSVVPSANVGANRNYLKGVAVVNANDVWAVGFYWNENNIQRTLIQRWNGTQWSVVPSPNVGAYENYLSSVAVVGPNDVWAVGLYSPDTFGYHTLAMHWNGTAWSIVSTPNMNARDNYLNSVAVVNSNDIWAVGYYSQTRQDQRTLAMRWNGSTWTIVPSPNVGANRNYLNSVAVANSNDVWAVGFYWDESNVQRTLALRWNGTNWNVVPSPNVGPYENYLSSVAVVRANDVWAVGLYSPDAVRYRTLAMQWDGSRWSVMDSLNPGDQDNYLNGLAVSSSNELWAVGFYRKSGAEQRTLVQRFRCEQPAILPRTRK